MFNFLSIFIGIVSLFISIIGFFPFLGWINWIVLPIASAGTIIGIAAVNNEGRNINLVVILLAVSRLMMGGGIF